MAKSKANAKANAKAPAKEKAGAEAPAKAKKGGPGPIGPSAAVKSAKGDGPKGPKARGGAVLAADPAKARPEKGGRA